MTITITLDIPDRDVAAWRLGYELGSPNHKLSAMYGDEILRVASILDTYGDAVPMPVNPRQPIRSFEIVSTEASTTVPRADLIGV